MCIRDSYNASQSNKTVPLTAVYLDLDGKTITNSYTLLPYKSAILIKSADQTNGSNLPPVIKNQSLQLNKNTTNGALVGTIQATDPNSGDCLLYTSAFTPEYQHNKTLYKIIFSELLIL